MHEIQLFCCHICRICTKYETCSPLSTAVCFNSLHAGKFFFFFHLLIYFKIFIFPNILLSDKQYVSRSGRTFCRARSGSKLFLKNINRQQKLPLADKELKEYSLTFCEIIPLHCITTSCNSGYIWVWHNGTCNEIPPIQFHTCNVAFSMRLLLLHCKTVQHVNKSGYICFRWHSGIFFETFSNQFIENN